MKPVKKVMTGIAESRLKVFLFFVYASAVTEHPKLGLQFTLEPPGGSGCVGFREAFAGFLGFSLGPAVSKATLVFPSAFISRLIEKTGKESQDCLWKITPCYDFVLNLTNNDVVWIPSSKGEARLLS